MARIGKTIVQFATDIFEARFLQHLHTNTREVNIEQSNDVNFAN